MRLVADLESNGLLDKVSKIHCVVTQDIDTGDVRRYHDDPNIPGEGSLQTGILRVLQADLRTGHNWLGYDEVVLARLYPELYALRKMDAEVLDTLIATNVVFPPEHLTYLDSERLARGQTPLPKNLAGRHSLAAWGFRLGNRKGEKPVDFAVFTAEMLGYCVQDVSTTTTLFKRLESRIEKGLFSWAAWHLEQPFAAEIAEQEKNGLGADAAAGEALTARLQGRRAELMALSAGIFPAFEDKYVTPKKKIEKIRTTPFSMGSRMLIARHFQERHGWKPSKKNGYTPSGQVKIDETVLATIHHPGVELLREYFVVDKILGMLAEGKGAWLKKIGPDGRIHGRVRHCGAVTSRCTHSAPNLSTIPAPPSPYWRECQDIFTAGPGNVLVSADASALEIRCLAHYLSHHDGGEYGRVAVGGDIHAKNRDAMGLESRDVAKRAFFAWLYGCGQAKLAKTMGCSYPAAGKARDLLLKNTVGLAKLKTQCGRLALTRGSLRLPDGRHAHVRSQHAALNTLLQGAGAIVMKTAVVLAALRQRAAGLEGRQVLFVHDAITYEVRADRAAEMGRILEEAIRDAGVELGMKVPMAAKAKNGKTLGEIHA